MLADEAAFRKFSDTQRKYDVEICALACHGNPVHPDAATAKAFDEDFKNAVLLAERLGINTIIGFSGCPGDHEGAKYPNWVTCPWPGDFLKILEWQSDEVMIPYWKKTAAFAAEHGVTRIAFEMHPGFCVYNPETLLKLRAAVGDTIGANLDPSHLIWQGMDPVAVIRELKGVIYHVHAKDTKVDPYNTARNGVLDTKHYTDELGRAWVFRTVGYGNGESFWRDFVSNLRLCGYDGVLSIEHEDSVMTRRVGGVEFSDHVSRADIMACRKKWHRGHAAPVASFVVIGRTDQGLGMERDIGSGQGAGLYIPGLALLLLSSTYLTPEQQAGETDSGGDGDKQAAGAPGGKGRRRRKRGQRFNIMAFAAILASDTKSTRLVELYPEKPARYRPPLNEALNSSGIMAHTSKPGSGMTGISEGRAGMRGLLARYPVGRRITLS